MRKRNKQLRDLFISNLGLHTASERGWFAVTFTLLVLYVACVHFFQDIMFHSGSFLATVRYFPLVLPIIVALCAAGVLLAGKIHLPEMPTGERNQKGKTVGFAAAVFAATFLIFLLWQIAYWPGGFSGDVVEQFDQVMSGKYNNWHPVFHTWLFYWLPYQIFHSVGGIIFSQILIFSLAVTYLFHVLRKHGCPGVFLLVSWLFLVLNPNTNSIMLWPWKDSAMTIGALVLFTQLIEIYESEGQWLNKAGNLLAFTLIGFITTCVRHNAVLLVAPVYVIMIVFLKKARKAALISGVILMLAVAMMNGPVFTLANVGAPGYRQVELLGLPMTVLSNVYMEKPEALSGDAIDFLQRIATEEDWAKFHWMGNFNSLKWNSSLPINDVIEAEGAANILRYTLEACIHSPGYAMEALIELTKMVWGVDDSCGQWISIAVGKNAYGIQMEGVPALREVLFVIASLLKLFCFRFLFRNIGVIILVMLFAGVANVGNGKLGRAFLILSPLAYNFGTMLLLTGDDFRFFHFNFVVIVPLVFILLRGGKVSHAEEAAA